MLKKLLPVALVLVLAVGFAVAPALAEGKGPGPTQLVQVTDIDTNGVVALLPNVGILVVSLEGDQGNDFAWTVKKMNPRVMAPVGKPTVKKFKSGRQVTTFAFKSLNAGTDDLVLHYAKKGTGTPLQEFKLTVKVGPTVLPAKPLAAPKKK